MTVIHNDNSFKIALITEDLQGDQSKEAFAAVCEQAKRAMSAHDIGNDFRGAYRSRMHDPESLMASVKSVMMDNYMIGAFDLQKWGLSTTTDFRAINVMLMNDDTEYVKHLIEAVI